MIDRVRYYDGEFLRAFDFSDEQTYHMEMRRRLNRYLHLYGIVQGLQLSEDVQGTGATAVHQVSILPGVAIDAFGREIYVYASYTLGDGDIATNRINVAVPTAYDVWLRYAKSPSTPPSSGYAVCNQTDQSTRWAESFNVVLLKKGTTPFTDPAFADEDTDDPTQDAVSILLGTVLVDPSSATQQFSQPTFDRRLRFIGSIAQRIQTPYDATLGASPFNFQVRNTPLSPLTSLEIQPNVFADQNLIVGQDFDLTTNPKQPNPKPSTNPGSVKIAADLFVQGNIYSNATVQGGQQWLGISQYIQQSMQQLLPEIVPFSLPVVVHLDPTAKYITAPYASDTTPPIPVATKRLLNVTSSIVLAYFSQIESTSQADFNTLFGTGGWQLQIVAPPQASFPPNSQNGTVQVTWQAGPASGGPPPTKCAIDNFTISGVVICFP